MNNNLPPIVKAAQSENLLEAALAYAELGFSVLPLKGKRPALSSWTHYQQQAASAETIREWHKAGLLHNIGLVCGAVSHNRIALDLDALGGYGAFAAMFPHSAQTYTVATGGGVGRHVYWQVDKLPPAVKAMRTPLGNLEICAEGRQIVAPPSVHPKTHNFYTVEKPLPILHVPDIDEIVAWIESFKGLVKTDQPNGWKPPTLSASKGDLNSRVIEAIARHFSSLGYKPYGEWLHGGCIYPERHTNGDKSPSFGFNTRSGFGHCYRCGTILAKDICEAIGIDTATLGGLLEKRVSLPPTPRNNLPLAESQPPEPKPIASIAPPDIPNSELVLDDLDLPAWLKTYLDWAGATGNQTPMSFHLFAALWLAATAVGRRLYADAPWGQTIYPNLYLLVVAVSTFYRKSTAYRLAEQVASQVFPHLLLPTPGSPERLLTSLAGVLPPNFKDLSSHQQEHLQKSRPFAAQRALRIDEIAGLLSAVNKRDYMIAMKDHLLEIYDCPPLLTRDIQTGLTIIERPTLSIFGLTTPAALANAVGFRDWLDGLFPRFILVSPERNYQERPSLKEKLPIPPYILEGLHKLYSRLPVPPERSDEKPLDTELRDSSSSSELEWEVQVPPEIWQACMEYSERLRQFCDPDKTDSLEERLRPVYGRLHVQALKLAMLLAALRWIDGDSQTPVPTMTQHDWQIAEKLTEYLRASAHTLVGLLDRSGEASREMSLQDRILNLCAEAGAKGCTIRDVCRTYHTIAAATREAARELVKAGLIVERQIGRTERYFLGQLFDEVSREAD